MNARNPFTNRQFFFKLLAGLIAIHMAGVSAIAAERPIMTYVLDGSVTSSAYSAQISASMAAAVDTYNRYGVFSGPSSGSYPIRAYYNSGVATANGSGSGAITFGGQRNTRVTQHELTHVLGAGQYSQWSVLMVNGVWQGNHAQAVLKVIDGPDAEMHGDSIHFWPYGLNYDSEFNTTSARNNILMTAAWRVDMGIGYTWPPVNGPANGTYRLTPKNATSSALRAIGGAGNNAGIDIATYAAAANQQFILQRQPDGTYEIKTAQAGNRNVDIPGASIAIGTAVQLYDDNNNDNQRWIIEPNGDGYYRITSKNHLLRLLETAGAGTADGTLVQSGEYSGTTGAHQFWKLEPVSGAEVQEMAYWNGDVSGAWNAPASGNTNWATGYNRLTDLGHIPGALSNVFFPGGTANRTTTLGQDFSIPGLISEGSAVTTIGGTHNLTLGGNGISLGLDAGAMTINTTGQVALAANQTWTNQSLEDLTVISPVTGAFALTLAGAGSITLAGDNAYSGGTVLGPGSLQIGNGGTTGGIVGNILNNGSLIFNRSNDSTFSGVISGTGDLVKLGAGTLTLANANSYAGSTTIGGANSGTRFGIIRATATNAMGTGAATVGPGGNDTTARLEISGNITLPNNLTIAQRSNLSAAVQNLGGNNTLSGAIDLTAGGGNAIFQSDAGTLTLGAISSSSGARTATLTGSGSGVVSGIISDGSGMVAVVKGGEGTWTLSGTNSHTAGTTISAGKLVALVNGLNGGPISIAAAGTLTFAGNNQTSTSALSGAGAILNNNASTIIFTGDHSGFTGTFTHSAGSNNTQFNSATSGSPNAAYSITAGELIFAANGNYTVEFGSLSSTAGNIRGGNSATGTTTLEVGNLGANTSISGNLNNGGTKILALTKVGGGTLTLNGSNSLSGATNVNAGTLNINGSTTATAINVASGAALGGIGSAGAVTVQSGGTLAPGATSVGTFTTGNTTLNGTLAIEIASAANADKLNAGGSVTLGGPLTITSPAGLPPGTAFAILNKTSVGAINGTFSGRPQNSMFTEGGNTWIISYSAGDGNDVQITVASAQQTWQWANFGANWNVPAISSDTSDPDTDGLNNLLEYALGSDPNNSAASSAPQVATDTGKLRISFTRNSAATDLTLSVMATDDLASAWSEIARSTNGAAFSVIAPGALVNESGTGTVKNVDSTDIILVSDPAHPKRFMRLEVKR